MKGVVFTEFFEFVEGRFSSDIAEQLIESSDLPSKGIYTSVGTYDHCEIVTLVSNLATIVEIGVPDLLKEFGRHLLRQFFAKFPAFFDGTSSTFEFLPKVDGFVHVEVKKLYPDAELPTFSCIFPTPDHLEMTYESDRNLPDLAEGLILGCLEHFGEQMKVIRNNVLGNSRATLFTITRVKGSCMSEEIALSRRRLDREKLARKQAELILEEKSRELFLKGEGLESALKKERNALKELEVTKISEDAAREFAESLINTVREPLIALDQDLRVVMVSRSFYEFFKVKPEETVGQLIYDLGNRPWDISKLRKLLEDILPEKATFDNYEVEHDFATIGRRTMLLNARQIQRVLGKERVILLAIEDITERKEIEAGLERTRKELAVIKIAADEASEFAESLINTVREPLIALDQDLRVVMVSRSFYEFFKVKPEETVGQLIYDLGNRQWNIPKLRELLENILPEKATFDNYEVEHDFATIGRRTMLLNARQIQRVLGKERVILLAIEDITERKEMERKIKHIAYHEPLTGLPNRMLLLDRSAVAIHQADRNRNKVAFMMLDLDKFKEINDTFGHHIGDLLLKSVAEKLTSILRQVDTVARLGGDEFVLLLPEQKDALSALQVAQKIMDGLRDSITLEGQTITITTSIGISIYPDHGADIDTILKTADSAMYQAKQEGRNRYRLYNKT